MRVDQKLSRRRLLETTGLAGTGALLSARGKMIEGKQVVVSSGAVASEPKDAVRVGAEILEAGGNAMDAAAATALACGVLQPELCGIGGYVLCGVVLHGPSGVVYSLDANSAAPAAAQERMFEVMPLRGPATGINANEYGCAVRDDANVYGPLAVAVPGELAGIGTLWERWGRLKWTQIVAPTQRLVAAGIPYSNTARSLATQETAVRKFEPTAKLFMPDGKLPKPDDLWRPADLEKTLARIARAGWRDFYDGELGRKTAAFLRDSGGVLTADDLSRYRPRIREPYATTYRRAKVYSAVLANGGITCLQALNMLECLEAAPDSDVHYWHRVAEVLKLAWRDRLSQLADPDFSSVPIARLLSKEYAVARMETLRKNPEHVDLVSGPPAGDSPGTTQISAADREGNLVAITVSHGGLFGSCMTVPGTGILLGHGMCRFDPHPGRPNSVAPRKRPLNNVAPTILRLPDRDVAFGLRGGRRIISVVIQLAVRLADHGAAPEAAATAPRIHAEGHEPVELSESADRSIEERLRAMGHTVKRAPTVGGWAHLVEILRDRKIRAGSSVWAAGIGEP